MTKNRFGGFLANSVIRLNRTIESSCISLVSSFPAPTKKPQSLRPEAFSFLLYCVPGGIRTHDHCLRRAVLYPAELLVQAGAMILICVAGVHAAESSAFFKPVTAVCYVDQKK